MKQSHQVSISEHDNSSPLDREISSLEGQLKSNNEADFFQDLERKLQRLKDFIESLGNDKDKELGRDLLEHFEKDSQEFVQIDSQQIIKETLKRIEKMKKAKKIKKNWSANDMKVLIWVICKYAQKESINLAEVQTREDFWKFIASVIPGTTPESCLFKWLSQRRYKITLHSWKEDEEKLLIQLQKKYTSSKNKWKIISEELYLKNIDPQKIFRHPKQCRQHYASFLDPQIIKGPWSKEQDNSLLSYIVFHEGQKKWCKLTKVLEGRTQNAIKNRYQLLYSKLKKKKENKSKNENEVIEEYLKENDPDFQQKKKAAEAVKIQQQEKSSVTEKQQKTLQTIKSIPILPLVPPTQEEKNERGGKIIQPIVLRHASNFKINSGASQQSRERISLLTNSWTSIQHPQSKKQ